MQPSLTENHDRIHSHHAFVPWALQCSSQSRRGMAQRDGSLGSTAPPCGNDSNRLSGSRHGTTLSTGRAYGRGLAHCSWGNTFSECWALCPVLDALASVPDHFYFRRVIYYGSPDLKVCPQPVWSKGSFSCLGNVARVGLIFEGNTVDS